MPAAPKFTEQRGAAPKPSASSGPPAAVTSRNASSLPGSASSLTAGAAAAGRAASSASASPSREGNRCPGSLLSATARAASTSGHGGAPRSANGSGGSSRICRSTAPAAWRSRRSSLPVSSRYSSAATEYCSPRAVTGRGGPAPSEPRELGLQQRADRAAGTRGAPVDRRQREVEDAHLAVPVDEHVGGVDLSVEHAARVQGRVGPHQADAQRQQAGPRAGLAQLARRGRRADPHAPLQHQVAAPLPRPGVDQSGRRWSAEELEGPLLALQTRVRPGVARELQRDVRAVGRGLPHLHRVAARAAGEPRAARPMFTCPASARAAPGRTGRARRGHAAQRRRRSA